MEKNSEQNFRKHCQNYMEIVWKYYCIFAEKFEKILKKSLGILPTKPEQ